MPENPERTVDHGVASAFHAERRRHDHWLAIAQVNEAQARSGSDLANTIVVVSLLAHRLL
jgi:hypothetical protein